MRGWEKLAKALGKIKKMTFRQPAQKRKSRPLFTVHLHALVRSVPLLYVFCELYHRQKDSIPFRLNRLIQFPFLA